MENKTDIALIKKDIKYLRDGIDEIKESIKCQNSDFVKKIEFDLVNQDQNNRIGKMEKLIYGAFGLALVTLGKAILELVISVRATQ
jgi:5-bromo-4-chloroindolyl phosphate hydrolysis protein